jgi:hypothetical protein
VSTQNKKRKETERNITSITDEHRFCVNESESYNCFVNLKKNLDIKKKEKYHKENLISNQIKNVCKCNILVINDFVLYDNKVKRFLSLKKEELCRNL